MSLTTTETVIRLCLSVFIGAIIGYERDIKNYPAGMRTHAIVSLASCSIMLTNTFVYLNIPGGDPTRMGAQVVSGIGFLGAGTILTTKDNKVKGLTTAAGVWSSAGIGLAIGVGFYEGAIIATILHSIIISVFQNMKIRLHKRSRILELYIIVSSSETYNRFLVYCAENNIKISDSELSLGEPKANVLQDFDVSSRKMASVITLKLSRNFEQLKFFQDVIEIPGVLYVEER